MHKGILGSKRQEALRSIITSSGVLAGQAGIDQDQIQQLEIVRHRDPQIAELKRLEFLADLLDQLATASQDQDQDPNLSRMNAGILVLSEVPGLTKTSREAITNWVNSISSGEAHGSSNGL